MKRKSKFLIISIPLIIILAAGIIYEYGIMSIREEISSAKELKMFKIKTLQKYMEAIAQKPNLEKQILALKDTRKSEDIKIIAARTTAIAAASLQNSVKVIITGRSGTINSEKIEKSEELGKLKITSIVLDAVFPNIRALSDTLLAMETHTPYLVVRELDVRARNYTDPKDLIVKLKIAALTGG